MVYHFCEVISYKKRTLSGNFSKICFVTGGLLPSDVVRSQVGQVIGGRWVYVGLGCTGGENYPLVVKVLHELIKPNQINICWL